MANQKTLQAKFIKTMRDPFTHKFIAFSFAGDNSSAPYTLRKAIAAADNEVRSECPAVFGADFDTIVQALTLYADLDKDHSSQNLFA